MVIALLRSRPCIRRSRNGPREALDRIPEASKARGAIRAPERPCYRADDRRSIFLLLLLVPLDTEENRRGHRDEADARLAVDHHGIEPTGHPALLVEAEVPVSGVDLDIELGVRTPPCHLVLEPTSSDFGDALAVLDRALGERAVARIELVVVEPADETLPHHAGRGHPGLGDDRSELGHVAQDVGVVRLRVGHHRALRGREVPRLATVLDRLADLLDDVVAFAPHRREGAARQRGVGDRRCGGCGLRTALRGARSARRGVSGALGHP
jgi:hypothetical protein